MQKVHPTPVRRARRHTAKTERAIDTRRHFRQATSRLAQEADIGGSATAIFASDPDAVVVRRFPDVFEWTDGLDGCDRTHVPLLLIEWSHGERTYVDTMLRRCLERDPELSGMRRRLEAECLALGAAYEIWTETEARPTGPRRHSLVVADGKQRAGYAAAPKETRSSGIIQTLALRLGCIDVREVDGDWIGRERLTGILKVLLVGVRTDPITRMAILPTQGQPKPFARRRLQIPGGNHRTSGPLRTDTVGAPVGNIAS